MKGEHIDPVLGKYKSEEFLRILQQWVPEGVQGLFLKTDLREEAYGEDEVLFSWTYGRGPVVGMDLDQVTAQKSRRKSMAKGRLLHLLGADARRLPFRQGVFEVIFSPSTLDHFSSEEDLKKALIELRRVAKPGAVVIIAMNNRNNLLFRWSMAVGGLLGWVDEPTQFFNKPQLSRLCAQAGFHIEAFDEAVVMVSPLNRCLLSLRRHVSVSLADRLSEKLVCVLRKLRDNKIKNFLAWFIVVKCRC